MECPCLCICELGKDKECKRSCLIWHYIGYLEYYILRYFWVFKNVHIFLDLDVFDELTAENLDWWHDVYLKHTTDNAKYDSAKLPCVLVDGTTRYEWRIKTVLCLTSVTALRVLWGQHKEQLQYCLIVTGKVKQYLNGKEFIYSRRAALVLNLATSY